MGFRVYFSLFSPQKDNAESPGPEFKLIKYPSNKLPFVQFYKISNSEKGQKRFCQDHVTKNLLHSLLGPLNEAHIYIPRKSSYLVSIIFRRFGPSIRQNVDFEIRFSFCFRARDKNWFSFGAIGKNWGLDNISIGGPLLTLSCTCSIGFQPIMVGGTVLFTWFTTYFDVEISFFIAQNG